MTQLTAVAGQKMPDADLYVPPLPIWWFSSRRKADDIAQQLVSDIDHLVRDRKKVKDPPGEYEEIILVGHSIGAVLARAIWVLAQGGQPNGNVDPNCAKDWAGRVTRLVLLAAVNRGWKPSAPIGPLLRIASWVGSIIELIFGPRFLFLDLRRGSLFLTMMRLQWLEASKQLTEKARKNGDSPIEALPITVQLLGTVDDIVAPADNVDLIDLTVDCATRGTFFYLEVSETGHKDVVKLGTPGSARDEAFRLALAGSVDHLRRKAMPPGEVKEIVNEAVDAYDVGSTMARMARDLAETHQKVRRVIFVVHGIRDYGFWTRRLAARIRQKADKHDIPCRIVTPTYGFFPMGPFLLKSKRREHTGWLMDQYVRARALYPKAEHFSFVGHSYGTYLLANALENCPAVRFDRVMFAGSVVRQNYPWQRLLPQGTGQVNRVLNYVATHDWVVATVPKGLRTLRLADIGGAGHDGFPKQEGLVQIEYVPGAHSAALKERHWNDIADFVLGLADHPKPDLSAAEPPRCVKSRSLWDWGVVWLCRFFVLIIAALAAAGLWWLLVRLGLWGPNLLRRWSVEAPAYVWAILLVGYLWVLSRVLTRL